MANRSDRNSALPRQLKRMITLMHPEPHRNAEVRKLFIAAHRVEREVIKKRLTQKSDGFDVESSTLPSETPAA